MARPTLARHAKLRRLAAGIAAALSVSRALGELVARGALERVWEVAYDIGDPRIGDADDVEAAAGWDGPPGALVEALVAAGGPGRAGFLDELEVVEGVPVYGVHDMWDHAPDYVRRRHAREQERRQTGRRLRDAEPTPAADRSLTGQRPADDQPTTIPPTPAPSPSPSPREAKKARVPRDRVIDPVDEVIPAEIDTAAVREAWVEWHTYRRERRLAPWVARTRKATLSQLAELGPEGAVTAIRRAIAAGWSGIHPAGSSGSGASARRPTWQAGTGAYPEQFDSRPVAEGAAS